MFHPVLYTNTPKFNVLLSSVVGQASGICTFKFIWSRSTGWATTFELWLRLMGSINRRVFVVFCVSPEQQAQGRFSGARRTLWKQIMNQSLSIQFPNGKSISLQIPGVSWGKWRLGCWKTYPTCEIRYRGTSLNRMTALFELMRVSIKECSK